MQNDDTKYRTVKVPEWVYRDIIKARSNLVLRGIASVPEEIRQPETCPNCGGELEGFSVEYHYRRCPTCDYKAAAVGGTASGDSVVPLVVGLGIGAVIGMGLTALLTSGGSSGGRGGRSDGSLGGSRRRKGARWCTGRGSVRGWRRSW